MIDDLVPRLGRRARRHAPEIVLVLVAAVLFGVAIHLPRKIRPSVSPGARTSVTDIDAVLHTTVLEHRDGTWRARPDRTLAVPTRGRSHVEALSTSEDRVLGPERADLGLAGAPVLCRSEAAWSVRWDAWLERDGRGRVQVVHAATWTASDGRSTRTSDGGAIDALLDEHRSEVGMPEVPAATPSESGPLLTLAVVTPTEAAASAGIELCRDALRHRLELIQADLREPRSVMDDRLRREWAQKSAAHVAAPAAVLAAHETREALESLAAELERTPEPVTLVVEDTAHVVAAAMTLLDGKPADGLEGAAEAVAGRFFDSPGILRCLATTDELPESTRAAALRAIERLRLRSQDGPSPPGPGPRSEPAWCGTTPVGVLGAFLVALLNPGWWAQQAPDARWIVMSAGLVSGRPAGRRHPPLRRSIAHARRRPCSLRGGGTMPDADGSQTTDAKRRARAFGGAARAHVAEMALVLVAATLFCAALQIQEPDGRPWYGRNEIEAADVDAVFRSVLLVHRDGAWRARPGSEIAVATLGVDHVRAEHVSVGGLLFPWRTVLAPPGAPRLRRRVSEWSVEMDAHILRVGEGEPRVRTSTATTSNGWSFPGTNDYVAEPLDVVSVVSGVNGFGRAVGYAAGDEATLALAALTSRDTVWTGVSAWRRCITDHLGALAADASASRTPRARYDWWEFHAGDVVEHAILAAVLALPDVDTHLAALDADIGRDRLPPTGRASFNVVPAPDVPAAARTILSGTPQTGIRAAVETVAGHLVDAHGIVSAMATTDALPTATRDVARDLAPQAGNSLGRPSPDDRGPPWSVAVAVASSLLGLFLIAAGRRATGLRRCDVVALVALLAGATVGLDVLPGIASAEVGLLAFAAGLALLGRRAGVRVPRGAVSALVLGALALTLAETQAWPLLAAVGRATVCGGLVLLALHGFRPHGEEPTDAPRRPARARWASFQLVAIAGSLLALFSAMLDPTSWSEHPPKMRWVLVTVGFALCLAAGLTAFVSGRRPGRTPIQPGLAVALAVLAAVHLTFLARAPFVDRWLSGQSELWAVGTIAEIVLLAWVLGAAWTAARAVPATA